MTSHDGRGLCVVNCPAVDRAVAGPKHVCVLDCVWRSLLGFCVGETRSTMCFHTYQVVCEQICTGKSRAITKNPIRSAGPDFARDSYGLLARDYDSLWKNDLYISISLSHRAIVRSNEAVSRESTSGGRACLAQHPRVIMERKRDAGGRKTCYTSPCPVRGRRTRKQSFWCSLSAPPPTSTTLIPSLLALYERHRDGIDVECLDIQLSMALVASRRCTRCTLA